MASHAKEAWPSDGQSLPRQPSSFVARARSHATLPAFDPSNGFRNARDNFTPEHAARWAAHRRACASEMNFKVMRSSPEKVDVSQIDALMSMVPIQVRAFLASWIIESLPCFVSAPLVACVSGLQEARNRGLIAFMFPLDPLLGPFIGWALVSIYVWARDELPHDAVYEVG